MATQQIPTIDAQPRQNLGTRSAVRLRADGRLPAVIYGHKQEPLHVSVHRKQLTDLLHENVHLMQVKLGSATEPCLVKDVQWNHLGSEILHVDLARVDLNERVTVEVDVQVIGEPVGLKEAGAYLEHPTTVLEIECVATQIPEKIIVDVSHLEVDQSLTVADLKLDAGITVRDDPATVIAAIHVALAAEAEEAVAAPAEGAEVEPEVIGKKVEGEDEDDAEA